ncbi:MAG: hypothetical protein K6G03_02420 [Lachnospiraceae bacterium]|nr:hypothetical protein [Lachnospiraceae bacterium]
MKTYEILGINVKDHSVRESLRMTGEFLKESSPSLVYFLTNESLLEASGSADYKVFIEDNTDMTIIAASDIYKAAGVEDRARIREISKNLYLKGLLHSLSKEQRRLYLLTQTSDQMAELKHLLATFESALQVAGTHDNAATETAEDITNDINSVTPYVVFAVMTGKKGADFINAGKKFMNTRLIVVLQPELLKIREDGSVKQSVLARLSGKLFTRIAGKHM